MGRLIHCLYMTVVSKLLKLELGKFEIKLEFDNPLI